MKFLTLILIASFVGLAVFGAFGMHVGAAQNHNGGCALALSKGMDCPQRVDPLGFIAFHLAALKSFTTATFSGVNYNVFLMLSLLIAGIFLGRLRNNISPPKLHFAYSRYGTELPAPQIKHEFLRWLAFHENSPASF